MRKHLFTALMALLVFLVTGPVMAQQGTAAPVFEYGGSLDPLGTGQDPLTGGAATQGAGVGAGAVPSYLGRGGPINLRAGGYINRQQQPVAGSALPQQTIKVEKPTSAAVHNRNIVKQRTQAQSTTNTNSIMPPGWGTYNP